MKYYEKHMSPHLVNKYTRGFRCMVDVNDTGVYDHNAVDVMVEAMRKFARKERGDEFYRIFAKHGRDLFGYMQEDLKKHKDEYGLSHIEENQPIDLDTFLNIHARVIKGKTKIDQLPGYIQDLPKVFFTIIDRDVDEVLSILELTEFFRDFTRVPPEECQARAVEAYNVWTENGKYPLTLERYAVAFEDLLVNPEPNGPGKYLFGHPEE